MTNLRKIRKLTNWHITTGNVLDDLFEPAESASLKMRSNLMDALEEEIKGSALTQAQAAKIMGVSQPRVSDLLRGKISNFTIDMLVMMAVKMGISVSMRIRPGKFAQSKCSSHPRARGKIAGVKTL